MRFAFCLLLAAGLSAQTVRQREILGEIYEKAAAKEGGPEFADVLRRDAITRASECDRLIAAWLLESRRGTEELFQLLDARTGVETGAAPGTPGAGSLAMKGAAPLILSMAMENGGVASEVTGTAVTLRATPRGLVRAVAGGHPAAQAPAFLDRFSGAATFDIARGGEPGVFTARAEQMTAWSARFEALNRRDPRNGAFRDDWSKLAAKSATYRASADQITRALAEWPELAAWQDELAARVEREVERPYRGLVLSLADARRAYEKVLGEEFETLRRLPAPESVERALSRYARELTVMLQGRQRIREMASRGALVTFDFTAMPARMRGERGMWLITGIVQTLAGRDRRDDVTFNSSVDSHHRIHAGLSYEIPRGAARVTLASRYVAEPRLGRVALWQAGLTMSIPSTGFRVPASISLAHFAARSKTSVSFQIGLHYNADLLFLRTWMK